MTTTTGRWGGQLLVERRAVPGGTVALVTLNRPETYNATTPEIHTGLTEVWAELDTDPDLRAVVLTGAGKAFSGGGDLQLLLDQIDDRALRDHLMVGAAAIVRGMTALSVPIIAAVNGPAVGLGCSLTAMCDLVLVEEQAYFADPHVALGLVAADGGALMWPMLTGLLRAKEHILLGDRIDAAEAVRIGIANRVVPAGTARDAALDLATRLAAMPPQAVRETKALLQRSIVAAVATLLDDALARETESFDEPAFRANVERMLTDMAARRAAKPASPSSPPTASN
jgi:enoyl-CoA hydratase